MAHFPELWDYANIHLGLLEGVKDTDEVTKKFVFVSAT